MQEKGEEGSYMREKRKFEVDGLNKDNMQF